MLEWISGSGMVWIGDTAMVWVYLGDQRLGRGVWGGGESWPPLARIFHGQRSWLTLNFDSVILFRMPFLSRLC